MAAKQVSEAVASVLEGEDSDVAYARLFGAQVKPCDFRRWFTQVSRDGTSSEVDAETIEALTLYVGEKMTVEEAFKAHVPDFVGPGEFLTAYSKEMKARKEKPAVVNSPDRKQAKKKPDVPQEDTVLPEGVTLI